MAERAEDMVTGEIGFSSREVLAILNGDPLSPDLVDRWRLTCPDCDGRGHAPAHVGYDDLAKSCSTCNGSGRLTDA